MSRHRAAPPPTYQTRHGRVVVLSVSLATTAIALLGGVGVLPSAAGDDGPDTQAEVVAVDTAAAGPEVSPTTAPSAPAGVQADEPSVEPTDEPTQGVTEEPPVDPSAEPDGAVEPDGSVPDGVQDEALPLDSGEGRRVVFSESRQRVWLVDGDGEVKRTYLVSGSLTDNLDPGTFEVWSRSEDAVGIDDSGTMKWFVRFTRGDTGAAIGFHSIPVDDGTRVQTTDQLGTPQSHGCIRQATPDAKALWEFAPLGSTVVVVA